MEKISPIPPPEHPQTETNPQEASPASFFLLTDEEQAELNNLNAKNIKHGIKSEEIKRQDYLSDKKEGKYLEPLNADEQKRLRQLRKKQFTEPELTPKERRELWFLGLREEKAT